MSSIECSSSKERHYNKCFLALYKVRANVSYMNLCFFFGKVRLACFRHHFFLRLLLVQGCKPLNFFSLTTGGYRQVCQVLFYMQFS